MTRVPSERVDLFARESPSERPSATCSLLLIERIFVADQPRLAMTRRHVSRKRSSRDTHRRVSETRGKHRGCHAQYRHSNGSYSAATDRLSLYPAGRQAPGHSIRFKALSERQESGKKDLSRRGTRELQEAAYERRLSAFPEPAEHSTRAETVRARLSRDQVIR